MRISVIVTYLTHDPMIKVQVLCPHRGKLLEIALKGEGVLRSKKFFREFYFCIQSHIVVTKH